ncbi:MAG TPA: hypothetical protein VFX70_08765 [Mycobacteriales bacterium]|nr:hypothetical protein [Mycobacteriales bacterium]
MPAKPFEHLRRVAAGGLVALVGVGLAALLAARPAAAAPPVADHDTVLLADPTVPPVPGTPPPTPTPGPSGSVPPILIAPGEPTPSPSAGAPGNAPGLPGKQDRPGFFDLGGKIREAIDEWFRNLVVSALNPILRLLGRTVLSTPDVTTQPRIRAYWSVTAGIANVSYVLLVLAGGAVVMAKETLQTRYALKQVAPRIVVGFIAANASLSIAHEAIGFANALSAALLGDGLDPDSTAATLEALLLNPLNNSGIFLTLLGLVAVVLAIVLLVTYLIRVVLVILLIAAAPIALACHATPYTEGLTRLWWRAGAGLLLVQLGQSLTFIVALRIFFTNPAAGPTLGVSAGGTLVNFLVTCCLFYVLARIPAWVSRQVFTAGRGSMVGSLVKYAAISTGMSALPGSGLSIGSLRRPRPGGFGGPGGR